MLYLIFTQRIMVGQFFSLFIYSFFIFGPLQELGNVDGKSTRLNSSHLGISYAVFCLKKNILLGQQLADFIVSFDVARVHAHELLELLQGLGRAAHFFLNETAATEIYPLSLHDALPI